ncbi:META domain-containing protein [uncultured Roseibium sp.]|uniref:META domain-containing protein n=1 Tax=uncultured Roseibium sp. TaxID=1936171 RepID=UPI0025998E71|nr:META domain-containing protein [uncultured Roseibium sp.]
MMKYVRLRWLMSACLVSALGAFSSAPADAQDAEVPLDLLGNWKAETIDGTPVAADVVTLLEFEEAGTVDGNGGCNQIFGPLRTEGRNIRIGPLSVTRKACPPDVLNQEKAFLKALNATRDFKKLPAEGALLLLDGQGTEVGRFVYAD